MRCPTHLLVHVRPYTILKGAVFGTSPYTFHEIYSIPPTEPGLRYAAEFIKYLRVPCRKLPRGKMDGGIRTYAGGASGLPGCPPRKKYRTKGLPRRRRDRDGGRDVHAGGGSQAQHEELHSSWTDLILDYWIIVGGSSA